MQDYSVKNLEYFAAARTEILPLLPDHMESVLEVGCGTGATLRWLKDQGKTKQVTGIELFDAAADVARPYVDRMIVGDAERVLESDSLKEIVFDVILCLDVLEHMVDPWAFVSRVSRRLAPGGTLIASIPNARHVSVIADLALRGRWTYKTEGILDRTHLRFFTLKTAKQLLTSKELSVVGLAYNIAPVPSKSGVLNLLTLGMLKGFLATQFIVASRKVRVV